MSAPPRDHIDTAGQLQSIYSLSEEAVMDIMAAAPYAMFACSLIDLYFGRVVEAAEKRGRLTPLMIEILGDFVMTLLDKAQKESEIILYLHAGFRVLGHDTTDFPGELDYQRVLPTMRLLVPRLVAIRLESLAAPQAE